MHRYIPLGLFVAAYMLGFGGVALANRNGEFIYYWAVMVALIPAILLLDRRVCLSTGVLWALAVWGGLHMAGGLVPVPAAWADEGLIAVLYNLRPHPNLPRYDQWIHAYGFGVATLAAWEALQGAVGSALKPTFGVRILLVCVGMGLGAINEVIEFVATLVLPETNVGGYANLGWDLISNLVGCVAGAALMKPRKRSNRA